MIFNDRVLGKRCTRRVSHSRSSFILVVALVFSAGVVQHNLIRHLVALEMMAAAVFTILNLKKTAQAAAALVHLGMMVMY